MTPLRICPPTNAEAEKRTTGIFFDARRALSRVGGDTKEKQNTILVLPFQDFGSAEAAPLYGFALADAIAARLARMSSLVVRPSSALLHLPIAQMDPLDNRTQAARGMGADRQFHPFRQGLSISIGSC